MISEGNSWSAVKIKSVFLNYALDELISEFKTNKIPVDKKYIVALAKQRASRWMRQFIIDNTLHINKGI